MNNKRKILVVDDNMINRALLEDILCAEFDIIEAENGEEAVEILGSGREDICLMLLDIVMPVMDGFGVLERMNLERWINDVPVIMISAETSPAAVEQAYDLGVWDFINRPFDERIVQRRVSNTLALADKQKNLTEMLLSQVYEREKDNRLMIDILSNIVEFRNGESGMHVIHIRTFTKLILERLAERYDRYSYTPHEISLICNASALHDIGKIAIPSEVLNKPGKFTDEEYAIMKTHSAEGAKALSSIPGCANEPLVKYAYQICRWHHERYDGRGYPDGLAGDQIPLPAQVVALADVYDALTSERVYKPAFSHEKAMEMILGGECGQFNPVLMDCLRDMGGRLKRELESTDSSHETESEIIDTVADIMKSGSMSEVSASDKSLRLLEHERMKYQFYAELSREIQFEFTAGVPESITLSEWSADYLHMPVTILNPRNDSFGTELFARRDFRELLDSLSRSTPAKPIVEKSFLLNINGEKRWNKIICRAMWENRDTMKYEGAIGKIVDIHDDHERVKELEIMAQHDPLTGLLNHRAARAKMSEILASGEDGEYALIMFDIDDFKQANDNFGHLFGDKVLKYVADTADGCVRSTDIAARMGGDEFIIFACYKGTVQPLIDRLYKRFNVKIDQFDLGISMGIACTDGELRDYDTLFARADEAMYKVKHSGQKGGYCFYED